MNIYNKIKNIIIDIVKLECSNIDKDIIGGTKVEAGQYIGKTGNSGTKASTLGTKREAHLHWELILQKDNREIYLGKDIPYDKLYEMLDNIFVKKLD